jgi:hypothetical protein
VWFPLVRPRKFWNTISSRSPSLPSNSSFVLTASYNPHKCMGSLYCEGDNKKLNSVALVRKRTIPTQRLPLVGEILVPTIAGRGCCVGLDGHCLGHFCIYCFFPQLKTKKISTAVNLGFLDRSRYFSFK